jgi:hypothetical protein
VKAGRQGSGCGIARAIGELRIEDPGGAGAEEDADALPPVARGGGEDRFRKAILGEPEPRQAVVAALELCGP